MGASPHNAPMGPCFWTANLLLAAETKIYDVIKALWSFFQIMLCLQHNLFYFENTRKLGIVKITTCGSKSKISNGSKIVAEFT